MKKPVWENFEGAEREVVERLSKKAVQLDRLYAANVLDGVIAPNYDTEVASLITEMSGLAAQLSQSEITILHYSDIVQKPPHYEYSDRDVADRSPRQYCHSLFRHCVDFKNRDGVFLHTLLLVRPSPDGKSSQAFHLFEPQR